jgi:hypothetical protein
MRTEPDREVGRGETRRPRPPLPEVAGFDRRRGVSRGTGRFWPWWLVLLQGLEPRDEENPMTEYLDPTDSVAVARRTAPRPASLDGKVVTLLDISKAKGDHLLDRLEELLRERTGVATIVRKRKPTFARPAPDPLRQEIVGATDVIIEALAD